MPEFLLVIGTRPEAIKLAPVIRAFTLRGMRDRVVVLSSGQHDDLLDGTTIGPDVDVHLPALPKDIGLEAVRAALTAGFNAAFIAYKAQGVGHVIVQGDTSTAYCAARVAHELGLCVHHVEAGLRTGDLRSPFPEEFHRCEIARYSTSHYAPTPLAKANLLREDVQEERIVLTGNTVVDELLFLDQAPEQAQKRDTVLITLHRHENIGAELNALLRSASVMADKYPAFTFAWARHPNPSIRTKLDAYQHEAGKLRIIKPLGHKELLFLYHRCALIMTDSGGIQEEAAHLGIPLIVLREHTERPEVLGPRHGVLCPPHDAELLERTVDLLLGRERHPNLAFGDGQAAIRIVDDLLQFTTSDGCRSRPA